MRSRKPRCTLEDHRQSGHNSPQPRDPIVMRALMNFTHRDGWNFRILAEDARTVLVSDRTVANKETLLSIIARLHGNAAGAKYDIQRRSRGSVKVEISQAQIAALRAHIRRHSTARSQKKEVLRCEPESTRKAST